MQKKGNNQITEQEPSIPCYFGYKRTLLHQSSKHSVAFAYAFELEQWHWYTIVI